MTETTFENAKVGERLWHIRRGWGTVSAIFTDGVEVVMDAEEPYVSLGYNMPFVSFDGRENKSDLTPSWFWNEVQVIAPERPKRKVVKTVERYANVYPHGMGAWTYDTEKSAIDDGKGNCIATVKLTGEYEIEE